MFWEIVKSVLLGIIEGVTEWLPVSSTGHLILLNELLALNVSAAFWEMFEVVIQLGAILAVVVLYFSRLNPFAPSKSAQEKKDTWKLWLHVLVGVIPSAVIGLLLDDWFNLHFYNYITVAITLIAYGIIFIVIETRKSAQARTSSPGDITYPQALSVGAFQVLSIIPGTSRSGSTIIGGLMCGISRPAIAEFSFFMAIPTMLGASLLKAVKFFAGGNTVSATEWILLFAGCVTAFAVSCAVIRGLMEYVRRHTFIPFGIYRIALGIVVLIVHFCRV